MDGGCLLFSQLDLHRDNFWKMPYMLKYVEMCFCASSPLRWSVWQRDRYRRGSDKCGLGLELLQGKHICVSLIKRILKISSLAPNIAAGIWQRNLINETWHSGYFCQKIFGMSSVWARWKMEPTFGAPGILLRCTHWRCQFFLRIKSVLKNITISLYNFYLLSRVQTW